MAGLRVGYIMRFRGVSLAFVLGGALGLSSCSGRPQPPGGGGGTTTLSLTMGADLLPNTALPNAPPPGTSILSLEVTVTGVTLIPASGNPVTLDLGTPSPEIELARLQSDSVRLGRTFDDVPSGNYTSMTVAFASPDIMFLNQSGGTVTGTLTTCVDGAICRARPAAAGAVQINFNPPLTLSPNGRQGLRLVFSINNALNSTSTSIGMTFTPAGLTVLSATTLPRTGTPSGALDLVEDFTGVVTSVTPSTRSVTVTSATRGTLTAVAPASFVPDDPFSICTTLDFSCVQQNRVVSMDALLNPDGTFTVLELEPLAATAGDFIEGVVASVQDASRFQIVTTEKVTAATTLLGSLSVGDPVAITISPATNPFRVDSKGIFVPANNFAGATSTAVIFPGQAVSVHVTSFIAAGASTFAAATIDEATLRFSRFSGIVAAPVTPPNFRITALQPFFARGNLALPDPAQAQGTLNKTNYDGVQDASGLQSGDTVGTRAIYLPPGASATFATAKVRKR